MPDSSTQELAEARIGRTLNGKWQLESLLGVGGTAAVYAATHRNGARVAIKILHPAISASDEARIRFKREGYIVNRVEHPGVVPVLDDDLDETDGSAFIVMDRADGVSLCDRVQRRLLDENEVLEVTEQLLEILAAAHAKGVIHRDLKPDNLLVDESGRVRLLDFGIARLLDDDANLTRTGFTFGTPAYMAPEQAMGRKALIGPRTDIYAVGATMFTMLTGEYVQDADNSQELLIKIATRPARSLADLMPNASIDLVDLVDRATMMHLEDRWQSAEAMLARVRMAMRERGLDGSRRHISSRISAMILPPFDADAAERDAATQDAIAAANESAHDPFALTRESGVDRTSVIRGRHTIPQTSSVDDAPVITLAVTTRPSLGRVRVRHPRRAWIIGCAAAAALVVASVGWTRARAREAKPNAPTHAMVTNQTESELASNAPAAIATAGVEAIEANARPQAAAVDVAPVATHGASSAVVPTTAGASASTAAKPSSTTKKPIRRPIDVGY